MQMIAIPDALDAMQRNVKLFLDIATGGKAGTVEASVDAQSGTASIHHYLNATGRVDVSVRFPALPSQHRISRVELDRWIAYFIHEICHAIYTDGAAWSTACGERLNALLNGMEDVRIERLFNAAKTASNSTELLTGLMAWAIDKCPKDYNPNDMKHLPWTLAMLGRVRLCGYPLADVARFDAMLSPAVRKLVDWAMDQLGRAKSTGDVLDIARKIQRRLANGAPVPAKADSEAKAAGDASKADSEAKAAGDASKADSEAKAAGDASKADSEAKAAGDASKADSDSDSDSGSDSDSDSDSKGNAQGDGDGKPADLPQADVTQCAAVDLSPMSDAMKQVARDMGRDSRAGHVEAAIIEAIRRAQATAGKPFGKLHGASDGATMSDLLSKAARSGKLRAQVARVLKAEESENWERARPTGRLDRFAFSRMATGDNSVFAKRTISGGYQTEIEILCDGSSSMRGKPAYATATLAVVIAQAAQQVGVKCGVSRFTDSTPKAVKRPNESLSAKEIQNRFTVLARAPSGMTDVTGAIVQASAKLAARAPGKRKLLFVVSDGDCAYGADGIKGANAYARRLDVETVVLCIDTPVHPGFGLAVQCDSGNIEAAGLGALVRALSRD
jgi:hypothetical protein